MDTQADITQVEMMALMDKLLSAAKRAEGKEVGDLTETERTAIAVFAGADMIYQRTNDSVIARTRHRVGIETIDGVFRVTEKVRSKRSYH